MITLTHNVILLATLAGVDQPDSNDSPGAEFLIAVMDSVEDAIQRGETDADTLHELAEDAPSAGTHEKWEQFLDLRGYRVDTTDLTGDRISARSLTDHANTVLVMIAENLIGALIAEHETNTDAE